MRYLRGMRYRWIVWAVALVAGVGIGVGIAFVRSSPSAPAVQNAAITPAAPEMSWKAGQKRAPDFTLRDATGRRISLRRFAGRPVIVTFIDPLCTTFCPLEARVLDGMLARLPAAQRPAIVAVSVNPRGDNARAYRHDAKAWKLTRDWHWAVGSPRALARVWQAYAIGVSVDPKTKDVAHTEAAYLVDPSGYQRALYLWPFGTAALLSELRGFAG